MEDHYYAYGIGLYPAPQNPPEPGFPFSTTKVYNLTQKFFVGAPGDPQEQNNFFTGICVQRNKIQKYLDHGEKQEATTPVPPVYSQGSWRQAACEGGQYVN